MSDKTRMHRVLLRVTKVTDEQLSFVAISYRPDYEFTVPMTWVSLPTKEIGDHLLVQMNLGENSPSKVKFEGFELMPPLRNEF